MLVDLHGQPLQSTKPRAVPIRARYDSAQTTVENQRHWEYADSLSAVSANSSFVRRKLRERSRYEVANNSYARGMLDTLADYSVGSGPTLQLTYRGPASDDMEAIRVASQRVEYLFTSWAYARKLGEKLHASHLALDADGEAFAMFTTANKPNVNTPVQLDVRLYECDHFDLVAGGSWFEDDSGIRIGTDGEPTEYAFSPVHPGDMSGGMVGSQWVSAEQVIHLFRKDRPGQLRGIPKTTPALPLFAILRRFSLATVIAAETAATVVTGGKVEAVLNRINEKDTRVTEYKKIVATATDRGMDATVANDLVEAAVADDLSVTDFALQILRASRHSGSTRAPANSGGENPDIIAAALARSAGDGLADSLKPEVLEASERQFKYGLSLVELLQMTAKRNGFRDISHRDPGALLKAAFAPIQAAGASTYDLSGVLNNVANKSVAQGFNSIDQEWRKVASVASVNDLKEHTSYALTGDFKYKKVGNGGEITHATMGEQSYSNQAETFGRMFAVTRTDILNDSLSVFTIPLT